MARVSGVRISSAERQTLSEDLTREYLAGASIRELAELSGKSYGFVHRLLCEAEVPLRGRGGATRNRAARVAAVG